MAITDFPPRSSLYPPACLSGHFELELGCPLFNHPFNALACEIWRGGVVSPPGPSTDVIVSTPADRARSTAGSTTFVGIAVFGHCTNFIAQDYTTARRVRKHCAHVDSLLRREVQVHRVLVYGAPSSRRMTDSLLCFPAREL